MAASIRRVEYFYVMVEDRPGEAARILSEMASEEVNLLAFSALPSGTLHTQLIIYPEDSHALQRVGERMGAVLYGPNKAFLITGDDRLGTLVDIHERLAGAEINVVTSSGVADGRGGFGYLLHVRPEVYAQTAEILGV